MDPAALGIRIASGVVTPLIKKLFARPGPGAGLVDKPVRIDGLVSFRGERRELAEQDVRGLVAELARQALRTGERHLPEDEVEAVVHALTRTLLALGTLTLTDVEAVSLGHEELARRLRRAGERPERDLSADATYFYERLLHTACLHILNFFTQRSTFVPRTLVEQSRRQAELIAKVDELIARDPLRGAVDAAFERRYLAYLAKKHGKLTIFGIDLADSPGKWPLDAAYLSLRATGREQHLGDIRLGDEWRPVFEADLDTAARPADEALAAHDRVLLRGEAGSGKTTLVQWLAVSAARQVLDERDDRMAYLYDRVPYVLPLRTLTRHGERLPAPKDFLPAVGSPLAGTQPDGWESRILTAGRALVLVDGIDEVPDTERARTRAWLTDLMEAYPGNRWLVTSRPSAVREDWLADEEFTELTLAPMRGADVAAFIGRWHTAAATGAPDDEAAALASYETQLLEAVGTKPDLGRLATNPLMCGLICALHRDRRGFLPLGRKDLYTAALSMLLIRRDRERHMDVPELREEPQLQLLQRLAYWLIRNGRTEMDRSRARTIIADALPAVPELASLGDADAVYAHFLHRSGLLREPGPGTVEFVHRTFQDFLGARAAVDEGDFGVLAGHAADDQWEDVIRMAVAQARPRERAELLGGLLAYGDAHRDESARKRAHLLAAACLEHAAELAPAVRGEVERRTAELIPPRSAEEARELGAVGPMVLGLLPGPEELGRLEGLDGLRRPDSPGRLEGLERLERSDGPGRPDGSGGPDGSGERDGSGRHEGSGRPEGSRRQEGSGRPEGSRRPDGSGRSGEPDEEVARLVAVAATHVRSDAAIPFLARYTAHPSLAVRSQLMWGWQRFDCRRYAEQVISRLDDGVTHFTLRTEEQIAELDRLGLRPKHLDIRADLAPETVSRLLTDCAPETLMLWTPPARLTPEALAALRGLKALRVFDVEEPWSLGMFPAEAPLKTLGVLGPRRYVADLDAMDRWPELEWVVYDRDDGPGSDAEWHVLARLPRLDKLYLSADSLWDAPEDLSLPHVTQVHLDHTGAWHEVPARLAKVFPALALLYVNLRSRDVSPIDAAGLAAALPTLRGIRVPAPLTTGLDALPDHLHVDAYDLEPAPAGAAPARRPREAAPRTRPAAP
ncbi:NACHT domain-containing protein [Streptomyces lasiicapitis]|nr:NACHT domain-containing protein [Streptomyces lasiicapitis]